MRSEAFVAHAYATQMVDLRPPDFSSVEYPHLVRLGLPRASQLRHVNKTILGSSSHAFHQSQPALAKLYSAFTLAKTDRLCTPDCLMLRGWHRTARRADIWGATTSYLYVSILTISVLQSMPPPACLEGCRKPHHSCRCPVVPSMRFIFVIWSAKRHVQVR